MSYRLNAITIHVNSAKEYKGEMKEIWRDITNGKRSEEHTSELQSHLT